MPRLDVCVVDGEQVEETFHVRVDHDKYADPETGEGEWNVHFENEWIATWSTRAEAEAHAQRIREALQWKGAKPA